MRMASCGIICYGLIGTVLYLRVITDKLQVRLEGLMSYKENEMVKSCYGHYVGYFAKSKRLNMTKTLFWLNSFYQIWFSLSLIRHQLIKLYANLSIQSEVVAKSKFFDF